MDHVFSVLLADDEPYVTEIIARILTQEKLQAYSAASGEEALHILNNHHVDMVITDILMPGMNGLDLLDRVKSQFPTLPVVVLTAHGDFFVAMEALNRGAFYFLTKPFNKAAILKITEKALRLPRLTSEKKCALPFVTMKLDYRVPSELRMAPAISYQVMRACEELEYPQEKVNFAIPLAVDELMVNAIKHGNKSDPAKMVEVGIRIDQREFTMAVEDEGEGFDYNSVPSAFSEEHLLDEDGRGIIMVRYYVDDLRYEKHGRRAVCTVKNGAKR